ncbi:MAG: hypothetical protein ABII68_04440 [Pseudomonadota bacterium]
MKFDQIKEILEIPKPIKVSVMLAVGFSKEDKPKKRGRKPLRNILFSEKWNEPFPIED